MARILRLFGVRFGARSQTTKGPIAMGPEPRALGDKLQLLAWRNPEALRVLERLVDDMLQRGGPLSE